MKIKTITDEELLDWILAGRITMTNSDSSDPVISKNGHPYATQIVPGKRNPRYRICIEIPRVGRQRKRRKRTIVRSKIVWMIHHRKLVPEGHELDHDDKDRLNDSILNILALTHAQHSAKHYGNGYEDLPE